jgi:hypothetical protein
LLLSDIPSDSFGNGGVILNMGKEIVGIQFENKEGISRIIQVEIIIEFLNEIK